MASHEQWEVGNEQWEVSGISGKLYFCSLSQWQPHCSGQWGVKSGKYRVGSEGG